MSRIIFIKDGFHGIKKGDEFDVDAFRRISISYTAGNQTYKVMYLDAFEGFYEEILVMPENDESFYIINEYGRVDSALFSVDNRFQKEIIIFQGWHKTKEEAEAYRDYCMAYKK